MTPELSYVDDDDTLVVMMDRVEVPGATLAYVECGRGRPLVLLHGGGVDHRMWAPQLATLSSEHRVIAYDARGHGRSSTPVGAFRHTDDLAALLQALDLQDVVLVGTSLGAATAIDTVVEHPGRVAAVVASGAGGGDPRFRDPWQLAVLAERDAARTPQDWIAASMRFVAGPHRSLSEVDPAIVECLRLQMWTTLTRHVATGAPVLPVEVTDVLTRRARIAVPVLAIGATLDTADHLRASRDLAEAVPGGRFALIDGAAHYPNLERPAEFDGLVCHMSGTLAR